MLNFLILTQCARFRLTFRFPISHRFTDQIVKLLPLIILKLVHRYQFSFCDDQHMHALVLVHYKVVQSAA